MTGSAPTNSQAVDFEKQQAAEAKQKEAERQGRLQQGQTLIDNIFSGQPVMKETTTPFDWSGFKAPAGYDFAPDITALSGANASGVPEGYTAAYVPAKKTTPAAGTAPGGKGAPATYAPNPKAGEFGQPSMMATPAAAASGGDSASNVWALKDASGKIYYPGDPLNITTQTDTGARTGGFGDDFYKGYNKKYLDYYAPQEERQYDTAKRDLTYSLARAGTGTSSIAADKFGDLGYTDALAKAKIVSDANAATGQLKNQILSNKESLINQLYATEDPTLTANLAQESANASRLQDPTTTPISSFFAPALSAVGSAAQNFLSPYSLYGATGSGTQSPGATVAAAGDSRGKYTST